MKNNNNMLHSNSHFPQTPNNHLHQLQRHSTLESEHSRPHRLDLYSVPVFILEVLVLSVLVLFAYFIHYLYYLEPLVTGFYCDDTALRNNFHETDLTKHLIQVQDQVIILALLIAIPITFIIFCELVNSLFGSIRFRQIRALCNCCKLHSITRRAFRFSGAYLLGFLVVSISCDILSSSTGRLRPYLAQDCPNAYAKCQTNFHNQLERPTPSIWNHLSPIARSDDSSTPSLESRPRNINIPDTSNTLDQAASSSEITTSSTTTTTNTRNTTNPPSTVSVAINNELVSSSPILTNRSLPDSTLQIPPIASALIYQAPMESSRIKEAILLPERQWIDLNSMGPNMASICSFNETSATSQELYHFRQLAKSWPSYSAAIFTYSCLFLAAYLCFAGTARPIRILTCILVLILLMIATIFDVQLVKEHFHHPEDVIAGAGLALVVTIFIIIVYLNLFRDTHYYEKQKMFSSRRFKVYENFRPYQANGSEFGTYNLDDINPDHLNDPTNVDVDHQTSNHIARGETLESGLEASGNHSASNNDLAMRYFQIPRANYRNGPRPLSTLDQMR